MGRIGLCRRSGLALLEVMFAACVLTVTLGAVVGGVNVIESTGGAANDKREASAGLCSLMEEVRQMSAATLLQSDPGQMKATKDITGDVLMEVRGRDGAYVRLPLAPNTPLDAFPVPLEIKCSVSHMRSSAAVTLSACALIAR